ncbi:PREDICTED: 4-coumarate--CoA ligase 1-like isoform X2 [Nicrophorus vespilloides]|uniref:4-coumarate--CoA ligase 1-like isoform X2 n=1 Tax=Nicrophorus vespilloides TaxID=110193 RepID=A0ABM1N8E5_NICVS|nr:PREDICTED: 4-coumarate--CoA ligase 1-like isoform X2 [Nicrophorus vespilloides]
MESIVEQNLGEIFYENLKAIGDTEMIAMINKDNNEKISYRELFVASLKTACKLKDLGIKEGDVVGIVSDNRLEYIVPVLACFYLRAIIHPTNSSYHLTELKHAYSKSKPKIIFTSNDEIGNVVQLQNETDYIKEIINFDDNYLDIVEWGAILESIEKSSDCDKKTAAIVSSSGTTGHPKSVVLTQGNLKFTMSNFKYLILSYSSESTGIGILPFYHMFGLMQTITILNCRAKIVILSKFEPVSFCEIIEKYNVHLLLIVPTIADFLAKHPIVDKYNFKSVNDIVCAGAALGYEIQTILEKKFNCAVRQGYGMTETGVATVCVLGKKCKLGSCGTPVPGVEIEVIDAQTKNTLGPNEPGEICVKSVQVMKEYLGNPEATRATIDERGFLHTGDIGYFDEDGDFFIVDRLKDLIKYKSFQVSPAELEDVLKSHNEITDAGVIGVPDGRAGELPMAFVVKVKNCKLSEQNVIDYVAERISVHKQLHGGVRFVDDLPKNSTGKLLRKKLREML